MQDYPFVTGSKNGFSSVFWHEKDGGAEIVFEGITMPKKRGGVVIEGSRYTICIAYVTPICDLIYEKCFVLKDPFKTAPIKVYHYLNDLLDELHQLFGTYPQQAPNNESIFLAKQFNTFP